MIYCFSEFRSAEKKIFRISDDLDKDSKRQIGISTKDAVEDLLNDLKEPGKTLFSGKPKDYKFQDELDQVKNNIFILHHIFYCKYYILGS